MPKPKRTTYELTTVNREKLINRQKTEIISKIGEAQATLLLQRVPESEIRHRKLNPKKPNSPTFDYVEHAFVSETLNWVTGLDWDLIIEQRERIDDQAIVHGYIEVRFKNGMTIKKHASGAMRYIAANMNMTWADAYNGATSRMLRAAAARLGLGLEFYRHEEDMETSNGNNGGGVPTPSTPPQQLPDAGEPAMDAQKDALRKLNITFNETITKGEAADLLRKFNRKTSE